MRQMMICAILALVVTASCSASLRFGDDSVNPAEDGVDIPASSLTVTCSSFVASPKPAYIGEEVMFWVNASSDTGSSLTFTIYYDYYWNPVPTLNPESGVSVNVTGNPGNVVQNFTYNDFGNFTGLDGLTFFYVMLFIDDGSHVYQAFMKLKVKVNSAPQFKTAPPYYYVPYPGQPLDVYVQVVDPDSDPIDVFWEFGDGEVATNHTDGTLADSYANQTHAWSPYVVPGTGDYHVSYQMNVTIVDIWENSATISAVIEVYVPENGVPTVAVTTSVTKIQPGESVTFFGNASDPEGEPLTWTFNYSDGMTEVFYTDWTEPNELVWCNVTRVFEEAGEYTLTVYVSDALLGYQVFPHNVTPEVPPPSITVAVNRVPIVLSIGAVPDFPIIDSLIGFVNVTLSVEAKDEDGDVLTISWYIGDSVDPVVNVSDGGIRLHTYVQVVTITETGSYNVTVVVTDGREGHEVTVSRTVNVTSDNNPPVLEAFDFAYVNGTYALPDEVIPFTIIITDREMDVIEVSLDFGDGSQVHRFNLSDYVNGRVSVTVNHSYERPDVYTVTLRFTDNKIGVRNHTKTVTSEVTVEEEYIKPAVVWNWWDYTSLLILFSIPVLIVVRMLMLRRRVLRLELEGMTLDEARIREEERFAERLLRQGGEDGA